MMSKMRAFTFTTFHNDCTRMSATACRQWLALLHLCSMLCRECPPGAPQTADGAVGDDTYGIVVCTVHVPYSMHGVW